MGIDAAAPIDARLAACGMSRFGELDAEVGAQPCRLLLIGNGGGAMWSAFSATPEAADGKPHPLDRWTRRVLQPLAEEHDAQALYPFEGPPWYPFQRWAQAAGCGRASPMGILMHPRYGLWHGYRAAFVFPRADADALSAQNSPSAQEGETPHACDDCREKPCLSACPVDAITPSGFDAPRCRAHVLSPAGEECRAGGCLARRACPIAPRWQQSRAQQSFHMAAFAKPALPAYTPPP